MPRIAVHFSLPLVVASLLMQAPSSFAEGAPAGSHKAVVPAGSRQLVLVRSANWWTTIALMTRYERASGAAWQAVGEPVHVHVGKHGMAWGRGLQPKRPGPVKREGDGRTPAGVFRLGSLFGYDAEAPPGASRQFSYIHIHAGSECVEDPGSPLYNQIIDSGPRSPMLRADGAFRLGFVIEQNSPEVVPGAGSCVFFHVQRGPWLPTSGCTSAPLSEVTALVSWLRPELEPLIVELPNSEYEAMKDEWALPRPANEDEKAGAAKSSDRAPTAG